MKSKTLRDNPITPDEMECGRRMADAINLALIVGGGGQWMAIRMSDGGSDSTLYETRADAIRHQFHETLCCYVRLNESISAEEAVIFLRWNRQLYDTGHRMPDPDEVAAEARRQRGLIITTSQRRHSATSIRERMRGHSS